MKKVLKKKVTILYLGSLHVRTYLCLVHWVNPAWMDLWAICLDFSCDGDCKHVVKEKRDVISTAVPTGNGLINVRKRLL